MNIVDIIIIAMLVMGMLVGFVRGFFKQTVSFVGTILVIILAYILKSPLSLILYKKLPFIEFGGILKGLSALNILMYEILAFIIVFVVLSIALTILIKASGVVEKLLKATIILAIPSKLLGMAVGFIQALFVVYIALFVLSLPMINVKYIDGSKYATMILTKTPIIPKYTNDALFKYEEIRIFVNENVNITISNEEKNSNLVDIMLKNKMVDIENIIYLNDKGKIKIGNIDELIDKYKEE